MLLGIAYEGAGDEFWVGPTEIDRDGDDSAYMIERWNLAGDRLARRRFPAAWLAGRLDDRERPPMARISSHVDGLIFLTMNLANPSVDPDAPGRERLGRWTRYEILDPAADETVASGWYGLPGAAVGGMWGTLPNTNLNYRITETPEGLEQIEIVRMELRFVGQADDACAATAAGAGASGTR